MPMHSSSLQTRISFNCGSREIGRSSPPLVTMSGTDKMNSTPLALIAARMPEPLSSILSSVSATRSASMRAPAIATPMREASAPLAKRKSNLPATATAASPAPWLRSARLYRRRHGCDDLGRVGEVALGAFRHHVVADAYFENATRARHQGRGERELLPQGGGCVGGASLVTARLAIGDGDFLHGLLLVAVRHLPIIR